MLHRSLFVIAALAGCTCGSTKPDGAAKAPGATEKAALPAGPALAEKEYYRLDLAGDPACKAAAPCDVKIALTALAGHKINEEYPTKFEPAAGLGVEATKFTIEAPTRGVMSIRVTPASAGTHTLNGQFKLGVCTDDKCEIDGPQIALPVTAI